MKEVNMSHPLIYVLGDTLNNDFPLILIIGREPNEDGMLEDRIEQLDVRLFGEMKSGAWVTAYTQFAKQYLGETGNAGILKRMCFEKNSSPIVFTNAFPMAIPNEVQDKSSIREKNKDLILAHLDNLFSKEIITRVKLVAQHGADQSEPSLLAKDFIQKKCRSLGIPYCSTAFFTNQNSSKIQASLCEVHADINRIFKRFFEDAI